MSDEPIDPILRLPINKDRKKSDLLHIAKQLGLTVPEPPPTNKKIAESILSFITKHSDDLATNKKFQKLIVYRSRAAGGGRSCAKAAGKTSAEKAQEDLVEEEKPQVAPTGANKKLLEQKITTDPPASFEPLTGVGGKTQSDVHNKERSVSPLSSEQSSPPPSNADGSLETPEPLHLAERTPSPANDVEDVTDRMKQLKTPVKRQKNRMVGVAIKDYNGRATTFPEIWLLEGQDIAIRDEVIDGKSQPCADLSDLLPAAINASTPLKKKAGQLYRPGLAQGSGRVSLGAIEALLANKPLRALRLPKVNTCPLSVIPNSEDLMCEIFLEEDVAMAAPVNTAQPTLKPQEPASREAGTASTVTGAAAAVSLHAAEAMSSPMKVQTKTTQRSSTTGRDSTLHGFLNKLLNGPSGDWKMAETAGDVLHRRLAVVRAFETIDGLQWNRRTGGYQIPSDYENRAVAGLSFVKKDVYNALRIGPTSVSTDKGYFSREYLHGIPRLSEWFRAWKDGNFDDKYRELAEKDLSEFKVWLKDELRKTKKSASASSSKGKSVRRDRSDSESDSGTRKYKKSRRNSSLDRYSSDFLDQN